ncbi:3-phosphoshikimate 1-carboxyvinyltransferase [Streptomyces sioyaensis]|uniref:3-phosphoshikimate 1-carboxyvinyltransferase n=1 Tax=Streptomyces sioyaensis TaxID=67364 RepID=UPI0037D4B357
MHLLVNGAQRPLTGEPAVPHSKYHAHRALILASLADGVSRIKGLSDARHVQYTVSMLRGLGVTIATEGDTFVVHGLGGRYHPRRDAVSAGSSGTTLYFMIGLAALSDRPVAVTGQKYFRRRPVGPLLAALRDMGVHLTSKDNCPPVHVLNRRPTGGHIRIAGTLSQWISGLMLLAPFAAGTTTIEVEGELNERSYLELTVAMMRQFGLLVTVSADWRRFDIEPGQRATPAELTLPPDIGSAAFGIAAAAIHPADVLLRGLTRLQGGPADHPEFHFLDIARAMGVPMEVDHEAGGTRIRHDGAALDPVHVDCREVPDILPILTTMASFAQGESVFDNIAHTRLKESDRAAAMLQLTTMGADVELAGNTLRVRGVGELTGARLSSFNDHRILMSLAIAASRAKGSSTLTYPNAYRISYPGFLDAMNTMGLPMSVETGPTPDVRRLRPGTKVCLTDQAVHVTLPEWLQRRAATRPHALAVVDVRPDREETLTWSQLQQQVDRAATLLLRLGVRPGDNVAYQLPNRLEFVVLSLAVLRIGAVCCPVVPFFREREVSFVLRKSKARVLVVTDGYHGRRPPEELAAMNSQERGGLEQVLVLSENGGPARIPADGTSQGLEWHDWDEALGLTEPDEEALAVLRPTPDLTAQLMFTSGTTGVPKGVQHPTRTLVRAVATQSAHLGLSARDVVWVPSPLAHQTGFLYGMVLALVLGVPQVLQGQWDAKRALRSLNDHRATFVQAASPFLADLVKAVEENGNVPRHLRIFVATGATVPRALAERAERVLDTAVCGAFGTTETCLGALNAPSDAPALRSGTDGRALRGILLRVTDDAGRELAPGEEGHLELHSPTVFAGYLDSPDLTAEAFTSDGWYRTGDLATIDPGGHLRITGRVKDVINRGGEKIPVAEIEQLLFAHPAIDDIAIVAMPDSRLGERACAFVVLADKGDLDFTTMQTYLDGRQVAKQYWPERLEIVGALPRSPIGKVQKFELRERARGLAPETHEKDDAR